ncbi:Ornithine carbamoyltransferase, catabolic [uncultured archaeon]|nr:Ornithine carbamoyltransferase, catabolic [uncultured archaeon]
MNFLSIRETSPAALEEILLRAAEAKKNRARYAHALDGRSLVMLFERSSTRTRVSFDVAMNQLGGHSIDLDFSQTQMARGESVGDTGRVLGRYADIVLARLFRQEDLVELAAAAHVPVINGLTDEEHPCQAMADLLTMRERGKLASGKHFCLIGDASRNMATSLMLAAAKMGMDVTMACPRSRQPSERALKEARTFSSVKVVHAPAEGAQGADVLYTDVWVEPGRVQDEAAALAEFDGFQLNAKLLSHAKKDAIVMHPLPARRGVEITSDVLDGPQSAVWDQAENRLHVQKAILLKLLEKA